MILLIDGRNLLYRATYASHNGNCDTFLLICRMLFTYYNMFRPISIHVFWDSNSIWRSKLLPSYKAHRDRNISEEIQKYENISSDVWSYMGIRQYKLDKMEADDLIFTFCYVNMGEDIMIISSDNDMLQIPFYFDNVKLYNSHLKKIVPRPEFNPIDIKCLTGDKSDNIDGYHGIGKIKSRKIVENRSGISSLLESKDPKIYKLNRALIDLAVCPYILTNIMYIISSMNTEININEEKVKYLLYNKYKIRGMMAEYTKIVMPIIQEMENGSRNTCCSDKTI